MLFPVVYLAIRDRRHVVWVLTVFVVGAFLSVVWAWSTCGERGFCSNAAEGRLPGGAVEANVLAALLIVAIVFSGALALALRGRPLAWQFWASPARSSGSWHCLPPSPAVG